MGQVFNDFNDYSATMVYSNLVIASELQLNGASWRHDGECVSLLYGI